MPRYQVVDRCGACRRAQASRWPTVSVALVGKRFAKKQQMQWSKAGAHLLLRTRTLSLDGTLPETFRKWYPAIAANDAQMPAAAA
jgi:hypothetical protein